MQPGNQSTTAVQMAIARAGHLIMDDKPPILDDRYARTLAGCDGDADLLAAFTKLPPAMQQNRTLFALRHRYVEDQLAQAVREGCSQYIILGAGLDSYALRGGEDAKVKVFEVDHPASQAYKRDRIDDAGLADRDAARYVPLDFADGGLGEALSATDFDPAKLSFFSCIGLSQYLPLDVLTRMIAEVSALSASGSLFLMQYYHTPHPGDDEDGDAMIATAKACGALGEPWVTFMRTDELQALLASFAFGDFSVLEAGEAEKLYLDGREDHLHLARYTRIARAKRR